MILLKFRTEVEIERLRDLSVSWLVRRPDREILQKLVDELENPRLECFKCHHWHRAGDCTMEDFG